MFIDLPKELICVYYMSDNNFEHVENLKPFQLDQLNFELVVHRSRGRLNVWAFLFGHENAANDWATVGMQLQKYYIWGEG